MKKFMGRLCVSAVMLLSLCSASWADVALNTAFPDSTFRGIVKNKFDSNNNDMLETSEAENVQTLDVNEDADTDTVKQITSLKGIEYFTNLRTLEVRNTSITALDLSKNTKLANLYCSDNKLTALDLSKNTNLQNLDCSGNKIKTLDVSSHPKLRTLACANNDMTSLKLTSGGPLYDLVCFGNHLGVVDLRYISLYNPEAFTVSGIRCDAYLANPIKITSKDVAEMFNMTDCRIKSGAAVSVYSKKTKGKMYLPSGTAKEENGVITVNLTPEQFADTDFIAFNFERVVETYYRNIGMYLYPSSKTKPDFTAPPEEVITAPAVTTSALSEAYLNSPYSFQLTASGTDPIWTTSSIMPAGISLSTSGLISGTPTAAGTFSINVKAANFSGSDTKTFTLKVSEAPSNTKPTITTTEFSPAASGKEYSCQLTASGTPPFTWTLKGKLPDGLTMNSSGLITGTPAKKGNKTLTLTVSNDFGKETKKLKLNIYELPQITTETLKAAIVGKKYSTSLKKKGTTPLTWALSGSLPEGFTFDTKSGKISGTASVNSTNSITVTLSNQAGSVSKTFTLSVDAIIPAITPKKLSAGTWGKKYKAQIKTKGTEPITLTLSGNLPAGLSFDSETGKIEGTPTEVCTDREITLTASNMGGSSEMTYSLTIKAVPPKITTKKLDDPVLNQAYSADIEATGTPAITFSAENLPDGLTLSETGRISGTPTKAGKFSVKITAKNDSKSVHKTYKLTVLSAPEFTAQTLKTATVGKSFSHTFKASGPKPITFSHTGGTLPAGISLSSNGKLSGKPTEPGTFTFTITAENSVGPASKEFTLTVNASTAKNTKSAPDYSAQSDSEDNYEPEPLENFSVSDEAADFSGEILVVAEFPEISVDVSGMYDFSVTLSKDVETGAELVWLANSSEPSEDDTIAEFSDSSGEEISAVPEDKHVNISAWLNEGRTYRPALAVRQ